jgi:hypothetical protein
MPTVTPEPIPAVVFLGPAGDTPAERWMSAARRACAADLIDRLAGGGFGPLYLAAAHSSGFDSPPADVEIIADTRSPFHFGRVLAELVDTRRFTSLAYFGAASAPLATAATLAGWLDQARRLSPGGALVNNLHSSDWAILNDAQSVVALADRLPTDNPLGWVLSREAGVRVETPPAAVAARADIDTPGDLALVRGHPDLGPRLRLAVEAIPLELGRRVEDWRVSANAGRDGGTDRQGL